MLDVLRLRFRTGIVLGALVQGRIRITFLIARALVWAGGLRNPTQLLQLPEKSLLFHKRVWNICGNAVWVAVGPIPISEAVVFWLPDKLADLFDA